MVRKCLISRVLSLDELPSLTEMVLSSEDGTETTHRLPMDVARRLVDMIAETRPTSHRQPVVDVDVSRLPDTAHPGTFVVHTKEVSSTVV